MGNPPLSGWWLGKFQGKIGWFPKQYCVEIVDDDEDDAAVKPLALLIQTACPID